MSITNIMKEHIPTMEEIAHTWAKVLDLHNEQGDRYVIGLADGARLFGKWLDEQLDKRSKQ